jgi:RNA methyltransferase, TrmH family
MIKISSEQNIHYKRFCEIAKASGIKKHGEFIIMGQNLIYEFLNQNMHQNSSFEVLAEITHPDLKPITSNYKNYELSKNLFREIDTLGTDYNLFVLKTIKLPDFDENSTPIGLELIIPFGDPSNVGATLRSAAGFGISKVILTQECANPFHPKSVKASAGAIFKISLERTGSLKTLKTKYKTAGLHMQGENITNYEWQQNMRLLIGEEGLGLPSNLEIEKISISTQSIESLNAVVAASIAMHEWNKKIRH